MPYQIVELSKNHYRIENDFFLATIKGNFRDAMVFLAINRIPDIEAIKEFITYIKNKIGGKVLLRLSPDCKEKNLRNSIVAEIFNQKLYDAPVKYISKEKLSEYIEKFLHKEKIQAIINDPNIRLLVNEKDYEDKYLQLFNFKKDNSSFYIELCGIETPIKKTLVTDAKIAAGLYSAEAEEEKIKNEFVRHFAFFNSSTKEFMATFQVFIDEDLAYVSDVIVNKNMRRNGLAQAIALCAFQSLNKTHSQIKHILLIGGGEGIHLLGPFVNANQLPLEEMTPFLQKKLGLLPIFTPPKNLLLNAGIKPIPVSTNLLKYTLWASVGITAIGAVAYAANEIRKIEGTMTEFGIPRI